MIKILLLGAEGCKEAEDLPYVRKATADESAEFYAAHQGISNTDRTGRPYWMVAVELEHPECPARFRDELAGVARTVRLD